MNDALISVIVPVFKVERYLDKCVRSIVEQTYTNLEIILVDDGSPDNCPAMCDAWAKKDNRIKVIHKANGGLSDARNAGMAAATGELIGFVDSDDYVAPEMYERLARSMLRDGSDIAACAVEMVWEDGSQSRLLTVHKDLILEKHEAQKALLEETDIKQPVWYKLYRRSVIEGIQFEVGKYHEDVFWSYQAVGNAGKVSIIDYIGYFYLQRTGSIMGDGYSLKRLDAVEAVERRYAYLAENFPELEKEARVGMLGTCMYHGQMALRYLPKDEQDTAFERLKEVKRRYAVRHSDYADRKLTHRLWLDIARASLKAACRLRNTLKVGC